jgi:glucose-6-phosphate 1-dehydrogenase
MRPLDPARVVRGRYDGYLEAQGVAADSQTETFVALECFVDNWRWKDVPFYVRTGKRLAAGRRVLTIAFKEPALSMFEIADGTAEPFGPNHLTLDLGDPGSISASFLAKLPGATMTLGQAHMEFRYRDSFDTANLLEAYERLIHDAMIGDKTLFTSADGIVRLWEVSTPLLENPPPVKPYAPGSWGPDAIHDLVAPRRWHLPDNHG